MISIRDLTVKYPGSEAPALAGLDLTIRAGETVLVAGPTGCGKTTLLNCLNGILFHESAAVVTGSLELFGEDPSRTGVSAMCGVAATVFQNPVTQICTATPPVSGGRGAPPGS